MQHSQHSVLSAGLFFASLTSLLGAAPAFAVQGPDLDIPAANCRWGSFGPMPVPPSHGLPPHTYMTCGETDQVVESSVELYEGEVIGQYSGWDVFNFGVGSDPGTGFESACEAAGPIQLHLQVGYLDSRTGTQGLWDFYSSVANECEDTDESTIEMPEGWLITGARCQIGRNCN